MLGYLTSENYPYAYKLMDKTYLFYDLETTGLDVSFDQIVQFAAIRCDQNLNELKRYNFLVKLNPDTIPSAYASITHHISISEANTKGMTEYEAVKKIHQLLNTPNTISLGFNTLGFDDEFLRFSFYRNLLDPYSHQYKNGSMRMDIYPMAIMYYLHDHDRLNWPKNGDGHISFKLEDINQANQLVTEGRAHDALVDVEVTLALARKLKENASMWRYLENLFIKQNDQTQLSKLDDFKTIHQDKLALGLLTNGKFGARNHYQSLAVNLGTHRHYKNQSCWLRLDIENFEKSVLKYLNPDEKDHDSNDESEKLSFPSVNKKFGETPFLIPPLARFTDKLAPKKNQLVESNLAWLNENETVYQNLKNTILDYTYPEIEQIDPQSNLYVSGFLSPQENKQTFSFHQRDIKGKNQLLNQLPKSLFDRALRIIGRINPNSLSPEHLSLFQNYLESIVEYEKEKRPCNYRGEFRRGLNDVYDEVHQLYQNELSFEQQNLLDELMNYLNIN